MFYRQSPFFPCELQAYGLRSAIGGSGQYLEENSYDNGASREGKVKAVGIWLCDGYLVLFYFQSVCNANSCFPISETFNEKGFFITPQVSSLHMHFEHSVPSTRSPKQSITAHNASHFPGFPAEIFLHFYVSLSYLAYWDYLNLIFLYGANTHYVAQGDLF